MKAPAVIPPGPSCFLSAPASISPSLPLPAESL